MIYLELIFAYGFEVGAQIHSFACGYQVSTYYIVCSCVGGPVAVVLSKEYADFV